MSLRYLVYRYHEVVIDVANLLGMLPDGCWVSDDHGFPGARSMQGQHRPQPKLFYQVTLEEPVPDDDFYRVLERVFNLCFVRRKTAHDCH